MHNSFIELAYAKIKQHQDTIFTVLTCLVIVCGISGWPKIRKPDTLKSSQPRSSKEFTNLQPTAAFSSPSAVMAP
jgi:hypothetical protein